VLGIACHKRPHPTWYVEHSGSSIAAKCSLHTVLPSFWTEQGNSNAGKARQEALTELREGLGGSPLQSIIVVITGGRGEPGCRAQVGGVS
jgi:hypothetical protein